MDTNIISFVSETALAFIAVLTPIIMAIVSVAKMTGLNSRYAPALALVIGIVLGATYGGFANQSFNILAGAIAGLTASGVYGGVKKTITGE